MSLGWCAQLFWPKNIYSKGNVSFTSLPFQFDHSIQNSASVLKFASVCFFCLLRRHKVTRNKTVLKAFILLVDWKQSASAFVETSACLLFQTNVKWLFGRNLRKPLLSSGSAAEGGLFQASRVRHSGCSSAHSLVQLTALQPSLKLTPGRVHLPNSTPRPGSVRQHILRFLGRWGKYLLITQSLYSLLEILVLAV